MNALNQHSELMKRLADSRVATLLEPVYSRLGGALDASGYAGLLRGEGYLGHAAHPMMTDVPIGFLTATSVLDLVGGARSRRARTILCALGVASAAPTAAAGLADWNRLEGEDRRLGVVHAAGNALAMTLYAQSTVLRLRGRHGRAALVALAGGGVMAGAGYLGGELALNRGAGAHRPAPAGAPLPTEHPVPEGAHSPGAHRPAQHSA